MVPHIQFNNHYVYRFQSFQQIDLALNLFNTLARSNHSGHGSRATTIPAEAASIVYQDNTCEGSCRAQETKGHQLIFHVWSDDVKGIPTATMDWWFDN